MRGPPAESFAAADRLPSACFPQANFPFSGSCYHRCHYRGGGGKHVRARRRRDAGVPWPSNGLTEIPFRLYTDPDQYRLEQERIFKGPTWNFLCLASEIPNTGITSPRQSARPVIVTRDGAGEINAFVNRCAHRGNLLCLERRGNVKEISCIYHGWTYDLTGN